MVHDDFFDFDLWILDYKNAVFSRIYRSSANIHYLIPHYKEFIHWFVNDFIDYILSITGSEDLVNISPDKLIISSANKYIQNVISILNNEMNKYLPHEKYLFIFIIERTLYEVYLFRKINIDSLTNKLAYLSFPPFIQYVQEYLNTKLAQIDQNSIPFSVYESHDKDLDGMITNFYWSFEEKNKPFSFTTIEDLEPFVKKIIDDHNLVKNIKQSWFKYFNPKDSESLKDLYDALIVLGCIKCDYIDFKRIFSGRPVEKKVVWCGHLGDLATFIKELESQSKIDKLLYKWNTTINSFCDQSNNSFIQDKLRNSKPTINKDKIIKLVSLL